MDNNHDSNNEKKPLSLDTIKEVLDAIYNKALSGIPKVSVSASQLADDYLAKHFYPEDAAKDLIKYQIVKCGTSGFITGLGGLITLPIAIPANITSVLYVQIQMILAIAKLGNYDISSDQVKTFVYACLTGTAVSDIAKQAGIKVGEKFAESAIKMIPGKVITAINQKVGFRLVTRFGEKGIINLGKMVPAVGGVIGGTVDMVSTKVIANNAYSIFIKHTIPDYSKKNGIKNALKDADFIEVVDINDLDQK